jgi:hypothetical protein
MNKYAAIISVNGHHKYLLITAPDVAAATQKSTKHLNETHGDGAWVYKVNPTRVGR